MYVCMYMYMWTSDLARCEISDLYIYMYICVYVYTHMYICMTISQDLKSQTSNLARLDV